MTLITNKLLNEEGKALEEEGQEKVIPVRYNTNIDYGEENGIVLDKWLYEVCGEQGMLFPSHRRAQYESYLHKMRNTETNKQFTLEKAINNNPQQIKNNDTNSDAIYNKTSGESSTNKKGIKSYTFAYPSRSGTREVLTLQNTLTELHKEELFLNEEQDKLKKEIANLKKVMEQREENEKKSEIDVNRNKTEEKNNGKIIKFTEENTEEEELLQEQQEQQRESINLTNNEELQIEENEENEKEKEKLKQKEKEEETKKNRQELEKRQREQELQQRQQMEMQIASIEHQVSQLRDKRGKLLLIHQQLLEQQLKVNRELNALKDTQRILQSKNDEIQSAQEEFNDMKFKAEQERQQQQNKNKTQEENKEECEVISTNTQSYIKKEEHSSTNNDDDNVVQCEKETNTLEEMQIKVAQLHKALSAESDIQNELRRTLLREEQIHSSRFRVSRQRLNE